MPGIQFGRFAPSTDVPEGRMLRAAGMLTVTLTSRASGKHITVRFRCSRRDPDGPTRWPTVAFDQATHVFVDDFDGAEIVTFSPQRGALAWAPRATSASEWAVVMTLRYLAGRDRRLLEQAEVFAMAHCRRCGRELTDPESIERGFGPDCYGEATGSVAVAAVA
jgi:hypothetical protein